MCDVRDFGLEDEDWAFILYDLRNPRFFVFLLFFAFRASRAPSSERSERGHGPPLMPPESRHILYFPWTMSFL